jgi:hypothetical protein
MTPNRHKSKTVFDLEGGHGIAALLTCVIWGLILGMVAAMVMR